MATASTAGAVIAYTSGNCDTIAAVMDGQAERREERRENGKETEEEEQDEANKLKGLNVRSDLGSKCVTFIACKMDVSHYSLK